MVSELAHGEKHRAIPLCTRIYGVSNIFFFLEQFTQKETVLPRAAQLIWSRGLALDCKGSPGLDNAPPAAGWWLVGAAARVAVEVQLQNQGVTPHSIVTLTPTVPLLLI